MRHSGTTQRGDIGARPASASKRLAPLDPPSRFSVSPSYASQKSNGTGTDFITGERLRVLSVLSMASYLHGHHDEGRAGHLGCGGCGFSGHDFGALGLRMDGVYVVK